MLLLHCSSRRVCKQRSLNFTSIATTFWPLSSMLLQLRFFLAKAQIDVVKKWNDLYCMVTLKEKACVLLILNLMPPFSIL